MYLWIGCRLPEAFEQSIRSHCLALNETIGLSTTPFSLPQHISLKISFDAGEQYPQIIQWLESALVSHNKFYVNLLSPERMGTILWLPVAENPHLTQLHAMLDKELEDRFGITQHPLDKTFLFHSTLFMDENTQKLSLMSAKLASMTFPDPLQIDRFLIGISADGKTDIRIIQQLHLT